MHSRASRSAGRGQRPAPGAAHPKRRRPTSSSGGEIPRGGAAHGKWRRRGSINRWRAGRMPPFKLLMSRQSAAPHPLFAPGDTRNYAPAAGRGGTAMSKHRRSHDRQASPQSFVKSLALGKTHARQAEAPVRADRRLDRTAQQDAARPQALARQETQARRRADVGVMRWCCRDRVPGSGTWSYGTVYLFL